MCQSNRALKHVATGLVGKGRTPGAGEEYFMKEERQAAWVDTLDLHMRGEAEPHEIWNTLGSNPFILYLKDQLLRMALNVAPSFEVPVRHMPDFRRYFKCYMIKKYDGTASRRVSIGNEEDISSRKKSERIKKGK